MAGQQNTFVCPGQSLQQSPRQDVAYCVRALAGAEPLTSDEPRGHCIAQQKPMARQ